MVDFSIAKLRNSCRNYKFLQEFLSVWQKESGELKIRTPLPSSVKPRLQPLACVRDAWEIEQLHRRWRICDRNG